MAPPRATEFRSPVASTCNASLTHPETAPAWVRTIGPDTLVIIDEARMADTRDLVAQLNQAARVARLHGQPAGREVALADGNHASAGDVVITRRNNRQLRTGRNGWVKNGDRWLVTTVHQDGSINARHLRSNGSVHLPPEYVEAWCELGSSLARPSAQTRRLWPVR
jgi:hypothetical protein